MKYYVIAYFLFSFVTNIYSIEEEEIIRSDFLSSSIMEIVIIDNDYRRILNEEKTPACSDAIEVMNANQPLIEAVQAESDALMLNIRNVTSQKIASKKLLWAVDDIPEDIKEKLIQACEDANGRTILLDTDSTCSFRLDGEPYIMINDFPDKIECIPNVCNETDYVDDRINQLQNALETSEARLIKSGFTRVDCGTSMASNIQINNIFTSALMMMVTFVGIWIIV